MNLFFKKMLCMIVCLCVLIGLWACGKDAGEVDTNNMPSVDVDEGILPQSVFGAWYPHPQVSDMPFEIYEDGTCAIDGQTLNWRAVETSEDKVTLTIGDDEAYQMSFTRLSSPLTVLCEGTFGFSLKDPQVWSYMTEWYNPDTGAAFSLDLEELVQVDCNLIFQSGCLTIEKLEGEAVTYTVAVTDSQAVVTDSEGVSTVYFPLGGNGGNSGAGDDSIESIYYTAMEDLQSVLSGGSMLDYVDDDGVEHLISGTKAMERLYHTFVSLQNYVDVSEQLNCIHRVDDVLVKRNYFVSNEVIPKEYAYNCYGYGDEIYEDEAIAFREYLFFCYDQAGNITALTVCGLVSGEPIYNANGMLTALIVTSKTTGEKYTAPVTCDENGNVVRIEIPFVSNDGPETNYNEVYEFLYDTDGKLLQHSNTRYSRAGTYETTEFYQAHGFYSKTITECYYDAAGRLTNTIEHVAQTGSNGMSAWEYLPTQYIYNTSGKLCALVTQYGMMHFSIPNTVGTPREEIERMQDIQYSLFHREGFVDTVGNNFLAQTEGHLSDVQELIRYEYEYDSIYIYNAE